MKRVVFVILHYNIIEVTKRCIMSIVNMDGNAEKKIVVVDNASPDGSGRILQEEYRNNPDIHVLLSKNNRGFANGNNLGYQYARERLGPDCIIIINNDIIFEQQDFLMKLAEFLENESAEREREKRECKLGVIGPDIVTITNAHQNPFRKEPYSISDVNRAIRNKKIFLLYFYVKKLLHLDKKIFVLENMFNKRSEKRRQNIAWNIPQRGIVLQGACVIFMKDFIENEKNAFSPETFMYGEEDILNFICREKNYEMVYEPSLWVRHLDGKATENNFGQSIQKNIFVYQNTLKGLLILKRMMKND